VVPRLRPFTSGFSRSPEDDIRRFSDLLACAIVEVDGAGRVQYANPSAEAVLGRRLADVRGLPLGSFWSPLPAE
jgi:PAS domain-containing protein